METDEQLDPGLSKWRSSPSYQMDQLAGKKTLRYLRDFVRCIVACSEVHDSSLHVPKSMIVMVPAFKVKFKFKFEIKLPVAT